jgi:uncharacterized membrane protein (TIGR02234 family)
MADEARRRRGTFGPVTLLGLVAGTAAAVAGNKTWAVGDDSRTTSAGAALSSQLALAVDAGRMPVCTALALVVLACWGVVLVTRGRVRRVVAAVGALAAVGTLASVVIGWSAVQDSVRTNLAEVGIDHASVSHTAWFWTAAVASVLCVLASGAAVLLAPTWPEMGSRYDAPGAQEPAPVVEPEEQSSLDLWRAMDEGRDPTT